MLLFGGACDDRDLTRRWLFVSCHVVLKLFIDLLNDNTKNEVLDQRDTSRPDVISS